MVSQNKKFFDCLVTTSSYETTGGETKYNNLKVGTAFQKENGQISIKLEAIPLKINSVEGVWINLFERKPKPETAATS